MNYVKVVEEHIGKIEDIASQPNMLLYDELELSKQQIINIVNHLHNQIMELQSELGVMRAIKREGN